MISDIYRSYFYEYLLGSTIVAAAGLVWFAWRIKKLEDPEEIRTWKISWLTAFLLSVFVLGGGWFLRYLFGGMTAM